MDRNLEVIVDRLSSRVFPQIVLTALVITLAAAAAFGQTGWSSRQLESSGDLVAVCFVNSKRGFVGGDAGYFAATNDGGSTWTTQDIGTSDDINEIYF